MKLKLFFKHFFVAIGVIASIITILCIFQDISEFLQNYKLFIIFGSMVLACFYALWQIKDKTQISIKLKNTLKVNIFYGDIFEQKDIIVIPVNEYFDTIVDNEIIAENTLHGKFIKQFFGGNEKDLKMQINNQLKNIQEFSINENRKVGNKKRYKLGTTIEIKKDDKIFYLVALTKFNKNNRAELNKTEYINVLIELFDYIEQYSNAKEVNLPLLGGGHSGIDFTKQQLVELILLILVVIDKLTLINGLNIVLHSSLKDEIDLNRIEYYFKGVENGI